MPYEYTLNGLFISYNGETKKTVVKFRDVETELPGTYSTNNEAIKAGQDFARSLGWRG
jgi:hypothetical protein